MKVENKKNVAASVHARLLNRSRETGEQMQYVLMRFTSERFLYRLSVSNYRDQFLLKGAVLFSFWFETQHRPTKDLDLLGFGADDLQSMENSFREICDIQSEDGLVYLRESVIATRIREDTIYGGVRIQFKAMLGNAVIPVQVDVGFGDAVTPNAKFAVLPTLLDLPAPGLRVYPKETVIAEKFEAIVKLGITNGRMKDFWDLNYLINETTFDKKLVKKAITRTFGNRGTIIPDILPVALTDVFVTNRLVAERWRGFLLRNQIETNSNLEIVIENLRNFFASVIDFKN